MVKKGKKVAARTRKIDPVRVQLGIKIPKDPTVKYTAGFFREVTDYWLQHGRAPRGVKITSVEWINPVRKDPSLAVWKRETSREGIRHAWATLARGRLQRAQMRLSNFRKR